MHSLFRYSCQHYHLDYLILSLLKKKSKISPTFHYPIIYNNYIINNVNNIFTIIYKYGQGFGILFRSVEFSVPLSI